MDLSTYVANFLVDGEWSFLVDILHLILDLAIHSSKIVILMDQIEDSMV